MVILIMGVAGSGKTTVGRLLAEAFHWEFVDADTFHVPANISKMRSGIPLSEADRRPWLFALQRAIDEWKRTHLNVVLACSALTSASRRILMPAGSDSPVIYLKGSFELIHQRLAERRDHFMHAELLASQFAQLEEPTDAITIDIDQSPEKIVAEIASHLR